MRSKRIFNSALASFFIFIVLITRDILVFYYQIIPVRSPLNRLLGWFLILPFFLIGLFLSLRIIKYYLNYLKDNHKMLFDWSLLLAVPTILYLSAIFVEFMIGLVQIWFPNNAG